MAHSSSKVKRFIREAEERKAMHTKSYKTLGTVAFTYKELEDIFGSTLVQDYLRRIADIASLKHILCRKPHKIVPAKLYLEMRRYAQHYEPAASDRFMFAYATSQTLVSRGTLTLHTNGDLVCGTTSIILAAKRSEIVRMLAGGGWYKSKEIAKEISSGHKAVQDAIGKINRKATALKLKESLITSSKQGRGYSINPKYKIILK